MTKNEFLLNVAIEAMGWGEGADFEMSELIGYNSELAEQLEKHYNVKYATDEDFDDDELYEEARRGWENALDQCQRDAIILLTQLKKQFECPVYAEQKMNEALAHMEKHRNNPQFYLKGKIQAIELYRQHHPNASIKEAYDYVSEKGYTKEGQYK